MELQSLAFFAILAVLVEGVVNVFSNIYEPKDGKPWYQCVQWKLVGSIGVGILVAFTARADVFSALDVALQPVEIAYTLTGFLISRGSNYAYELIAALRTARQVDVRRIETTKPGP